MALQDVQNGTQKALNVGTYNVWLMPSIVTFLAHRFGVNISPCKMTRAREIAHVVPQDLDVLVLCEAFCKSSTNELCRLLREKHGLKHRTRVLGSKSRICCSRKLLSGGICIVSRYPLEEVEEYPFGSVCARDDSLADKGVLYAKFRTEHGLVVNVFATHTQAWDEPSCRDARAQQILHIRNLIEEKNIPRDEVVLVMGDLNVPHTVEDEYEFMVGCLRCRNPNETLHVNPSFNHVTNALAAKGPSSSGTSATVDYILVSEEHLMPALAKAEVIPLKARSPYEYKGRTLVDLSDHYPVFGSFHFNV